MAWVPRASLTSTQPTYARLILTSSDHKLERKAIHQTIVKVPLQSFFRRSQLLSIRISSESAAQPILHVNTKSATQPMANPK